MKTIRYWPLYVLMIFCVSAAAVSAADCPTIVKTALDATDLACAETGRNQACYGNINLSAEAVDDAPAFTFTEPGDLVQIASVKNFVLSPLDTDEDAWGVALMKIQANLPETLPGQNVTLILFGDVEVTNAAEEEQTPLQAFYFKSGLNDAPCEQAPSSGILIQTPEGQGKINLTVNEAQITLGSSAYFQAQPGGEMTVSVVEGEGTVTSDGVTVTIPAGSRARVPLDANGAADGEPVGPEPYVEAELVALPLSLLPEGIIVAPALEATPEATASGDAIAPLPGSWTYTVTEAVGTGECAAYVTAGIFPSISLTLGDAPFDIVTFMNSSGQTAPGDIVVENPEPNRFIATMTVEGQPLTYDFTIVSETEISVVGQTDAGGCGITLNISIIHNG
ncbi:MAG: hypothetical protein LCI00_11075 [Chloroflexi bacterium]|nr:hypothetical protein [Chloroflexota bacterium]MCC6891898.1 hypothetical protein [Anaerolineae bacterium]